MGVKLNTPALKRGVSSRSLLTFIALFGEDSFVTYGTLKILFSKVN